MIQPETVPPKANILVVDDIPANLHLFAKILTQQGYKVRSAVTGALALSGAKAIQPDLILLDILMPELDGYQVCTLLKADPITQDIPVIFISALGEEIDKVRAFEVGAVDYITKPFLKSEVLARIEYHICAHHTQQELLKQNLRLQQEIQYRQTMEIKLEKFSFHLKQIHRLSTSYYRSIDELFRDYLQTGCSILECSLGLVGHVEEKSYVIDAIESTVDGVSPSWKLEWKNTYFDRIISTESTVTHQPSHPLQLDAVLLESFIGTPIWVQGELYGILSFGSIHERTEEFSVQEQETLELMAQSLGKWIGIRQTALKRQQAEEETQLLLRVTQAISQSPDFETALTSALQHLCEASGWSYGEAWIPSTDGSELHLSPAWYAHVQETAEVLGYLHSFRLGRQSQTWTKGEGLLGRVWAGGEAEYVSDVPKRGREICQQEQLAGWCHIQEGLWIPIRCGEREGGAVLAILVLFLSGISTLLFHHQSSHLLDLASAIASQLGTVIRQKQIEAEQQALLKAMEDLILVYDAQGVCLKCVTNNPKLLIEPAAEKLHKQLHECLPPAEAQLHLEAIQRAIRTRETQTIEYHLMRGDRRLWFSGKISPLSPETALLVVRDITPLEEATLALRQSEARFRAIFEQAGIGIYLTTLDGAFLETNSAFQAFLGYSAAELKQLHCADVIYPDDFNSEDQDFQCLLLGQIEAYQVEKRYLHRQGKLLWGRLTLSAVQAENQIQFIFGMVEDITQRHQIELALKESETRYRELIEVQQDVLVCRWKPDTQLTFVNQYFCQFFGQSASQLIGQKLNDFLVDDSLEPEIKSKIITLMRNLTPESWEYEYRSDDGYPRWLRWTNQPILDRWGTLVDIQSFGVDITAQKQRELALKLIAEGTASATGTQFFHSCSQCLANVLKVRYAFICQVVDLPLRLVKVLSFWNGTQWQEVKSFETIGDPCEQVLSGEEVYYGDRLPEAFPHHQSIQTLQAQSYWGLPLKNTRQEVIGYLAILDQNPLIIDKEKRAIIDIFVARTEAELEREISGEKLQKIARQERSISQILQQMKETLELDTILAVTTAEMRQLFQCDRIAIYQLNPDWSGQFIAESLDPAWTPLVDKNHPLKLPSEIITDESCALKAWIDTPSQRSSSWFTSTIPTQFSRQPQYLSMEDIYQAGFELTYFKFIEKLQARAYLILPIFCTHQLWGFLGVYQNSSPRHWQEDEIRMGVYITTQLGISIQQAELVTQIQSQSKELKIAKENADAANRAKSIFLAKMSHELRTPLNAILGFAQVMDRDHTLSPTQQNQLKIINQSGEHLLTLINDVLEMSRIEAGKISLNCTNFDLLKTLENLHHLFQKRAKLKTLSLQFKVEESVPQYVYGDAEKLRQVLINLLENGIKFTAQGSILLEIKLSESSSCFLYDNSLQNRDRGEVVPIKFTISDTGIGIDPEQFKNLFEPFQIHLPLPTESLLGSGTTFPQTQDQTSEFSEYVQREQEGTGLGLAISQNFVQLMGGELTVESTVGKGTTFHFEIPLEIGSPELVTDHDPLEKIVGLAPDQPPYRILVADDDPDQRLLMVHCLREIGFEVLEASDGEEAIALWSTWEPHLIAMDMQMPIINGLEAAQRIKSTLKGQATIIIALTAHLLAEYVQPEKEDRQAIIAAGCDNFITKPWNEQTLLVKIAQHLGVRYVYAACEISPQWGVNPPDSPEEVTWDWQTFPPDWLSALYQAAVEADPEAILGLMGQIAHTSLKDWLVYRVNNFEFERICDEIMPFLPAHFHSEKP